MKPKTVAGMQRQAMVASLAMLLLESLGVMLLAGAVSPGSRFVIGVGLVLLGVCSGALLLLIVAFAQVYSKPKVRFPPGGARKRSWRG